MTARLRVQEGGSGEPLLVLLHGLGATGDVWGKWSPLLARRWPGRWIAPDLPGHGGSPPLAAYTFDGLAAAVADSIAHSQGVVPPDQHGGGLRAIGGSGPSGSGVSLGDTAPGQQSVPPDQHIVVLGHSLGGVVGLALASGTFGVPIQAVIGLGIKVAWTDEELDRAKAVACRPTAWFASRDEAAARYLRVSGLADLLPSADPAVDAGLREQDGRWRLAMDSLAFAVGAPDMADLLARSQAPVTLARGEHDPMNTDQQLSRLGVPTRTLPGLGHNAHVENPELAITLLAWGNDPPHPPAALDAHR
jgi:pimeloyl-ACP methyl ester carboxylesterase